MKTIFKYISISFVIATILLSCISFSAFAETTEGETSVGGPQEFMNDYGQSNSYLWYKYIENETETKRVYAFVYTPLPDDIEYTESGDTITFHTNNKSRQRGYDYIFSSSKYSKKYDSTPGIYDFTVNVAEKVVNDRDCEDLRLCFNGHLYDPNALNVEVSFSPALVGEVDRTLTNGSNSGMMNQLVMSVQNNSRFGVQYRMRIFKKDKDSLRGNDQSTDTYYDDDPVFVYYSNEWTYTVPYDTHDQFWSVDPVSQNKPTQWHYISAKSPDIVIFDFNQINLHEGEEYTVIVDAIRCDYGQSSNYFTSLVNDDRIYTELKQLDSNSIATVYTSDFKMLQYRDVVYSPDSSENGVLPYNGYAGTEQGKRYALSRSAQLLPDGSIDYKDVNVYDDKNSWYNNPSSYNGHYDYGVNYDNTSSNGSSNYTDILSKLGGVYSFFGAVLGFFPTDAFKIINIALWSSLFIIIFRRLR